MLAKTKLLFCKVQGRISGWAKRERAGFAHLQVVGSSPVQQIGQLDVCGFRANVAIVAAECRLTAAAAATASTPGAWPPAQVPQSRHHAAIAKGHELNPLR